MNKFYPVLLCLALGTVLLAGCQSQPVENQQISDEVNEELNLPYSEGPDAPPSVKGPTGPPPGGVMNESEATLTDDVQAVTEVEDITITIPADGPSSTGPIGAPGQ